MLSALPLQAEPFALPREQLTPGGVAIIALKHSEQRPVGSYGEVPIAVMSHESKWVAVVGIPLGSNAGQHGITITNPSAARGDYAFYITGKAYPEQHLTIKNKRQVNPNETDMKRIRKDRTAIANAKRFRQAPLLASRFDVPVEGIQSSSFGSRRFFNKQPRRPHGGMDIAAVEGTPIYAPADAKVIETGDFFFSGKCIFLAHGQGLQTFYAHLSKIDITPGENVVRGQKIGEVGATGRVTGAHLHWSVGLNQTWVDPLLFMHPAEN